MSSSRTALVDRLVAHAAHHGLADQSLRELATAVGTSHRMLIYHFGSRAGVVAAVVERVEADQREALVALGADATDPREVVERQWAQLSDPAMAPFVRLFFEVTAQAMFGRPGTEGFLERLTEPWLTTGAEVADGLGGGGTEWPDETDLRLGVAVMRGLLLDAVTSGDPGPAGAALERFLDRFLERVPTEPPRRGR